MSNKSGNKSAAGTQKPLVAPTGMDTSAEDSKRPVAVILILMGACILTAIIQGAAHYFLPKESYLYAFLLERSWIQHATLTVFWFTLLRLVVSSVNHTTEKKAVETVEKAVDEALNTELGNTLVWNDADRVESFIEERVSDRQKQSLTVKRIFNGLSRLRKTQSTTELDDYFKTRSEVDFSDLEAKYGTTNYLIWLIPTLGFIGTVMGIGRGIAGFANIIQHADEFAQIKEALPSVTAALGTAFDTTFLALLLSVVVVCYFSVLRKSQESLLNRIDTLCYDGILSMFREHSQDTEELVAAINECVTALRKTMNGNRVAIENLISTMSSSIQELVKTMSDTSGPLGALSALAGAGKGLGKNLEEINRNNNNAHRVLHNDLKTLNQKIEEIAGEARRASEFLEAASPEKAAKPRPPKEKEPASQAASKAAEKDDGHDGRKQDAPEPQAKEPKEEKAPDKKPGPGVPPRWDGNTLPGGPQSNDDRSNTDPFANL